jgi:hypothetical protein
MANFWDNDPVAAPAPSNGKASASAAAYKPTADDTKTLTDMAKGIPMKQLLARRAAEAMAVQGTGASAIPTGPALAKWNVFGMDMNPVRGAVTAMAGLAPNATVPFTGAKAGDLADRLQRLDQINSQTFANMRPEGSGRIMQSEVQPFKQAFPSTGAFGVNNGDSAGQFQKDYEDSLKEYQFVSHFVKNGHGSAADARVAYETQAGQGAPQAAADPRQQLNAALKARSAQGQSDPLGIR